MLVISCSTVAQATSPADEARELIATAGVEGGLVVHLGCGDGSLTKALLANDDYLVQGLDADSRNVRMARRNLQSAGVYGRVSIDRLRSRSLPYRDGLVNLVVVEAPEAAHRPS